MFLFKCSAVLSVCLSVRQNGDWHTTNKKIILCQKSVVFLMPRDRNQQPPACGAFGSDTWSDGFSIIWSRGGNLLTPCCSWVLQQKEFFWCHAIVGCPGLQQGRSSFCATLQSGSQGFGGGESSLCCVAFRAPAGELCSCHPIARWQGKAAEAAKS